jgi:23S rRNA (guanosine2251-2'-O)-methyltransferase
MKKLKLEELNRKTIDDFKSSEKIPVCVVLDDVRSMLNVGSIFRTSDAFLVEKIYLCGITGQPPHREIQKTALGATESVDWEYYENVVLLIDKLKADDYIIAGIEQTDHSVYMNDFVVNGNQKYALVFGNEVEGINDNLLEKLDIALEIPQHGVKHSLNVSVAAGIVLFKFFESLKTS